MLKNYIIYLRGNVTDLVDGFEVYKTYLAIKLHFTRDNYNFDQYNGGTRDY